MIAHPSFRGTQLKVTGTEFSLAVLWVSGEAHGGHQQPTGGPKTEQGCRLAHVPTGWLDAAPRAGRQEAGLNQRKGPREWEQCCVGSPRPQASPPPESSVCWPSQLHLSGCGPWAPPGRHRPLPVGAPLPKRLLEAGHSSVHTAADGHKPVAHLQADEAAVLLPLLSQGHQAAEHYCPPRPGPLLSLPLAQPRLTGHRFSPINTDTVL